MMRTLAEFVMRGRIQAVVVASLGVIFPLFTLLTPAVIGLVTLRKGWQEAAVVIVGSVVTAAGLAAVEGLGGLAVYISVGAIFVASCAAQVLRLTVYWPAVLAAIVAFSVLATLAAAAGVADPTDGIRELYQQMLAAQPPEARQQLEEIFSGLSATLVVGAMALSVALYSLLGLIVARWWQAILFNPGGLSKELHQLRLPPILAMACVLGIVVCQWRGDGYVYWQILGTLPLLTAGLGLCHWLVARKRWGVGPLVALYCFLLFPPIWFAVMVLGLSDVWIDYRKRFNFMQQ